MMRSIFALFSLIFLSSCYQQEKKCEDFKTGEFEFTYTINGEEKTSRFIRNDTLEIDYFENGTICWFTPADFSGNNELSTSNRKLIPEAFQSNGAELFPKYSVYLVSIGATLGKVSFFREPASANQQINVLSFFENEMNRRSVLKIKLTVVILWLFF